MGGEPLTLIPPVALCQSEGILERINEPPWARCLQGVDDARWVVVVVCRRRLTGGHFGLIVLRHTASLC